MRFRSESRPNEYGYLAIHDDGTFQLKPSADLRDEMARMEENALIKSKKISFPLGFGLIGLGVFILGLGWYIGRVFGKLGSSLSSPRPIDEVELIRDENGVMRLKMQGIENKMQTIQMAWSAEEIAPCDMDEFITKFDEMKSQARG